MEHSSSNRFLNTQKSKVHAISSLHPTPPKENEPPSPTHSPSHNPLISRDPRDLVKNIHAMTLIICICEQDLPHNNPSQEYNNQFMVGIHE
jgi:hypothetical protein